MAEPNISLPETPKSTDTDASNSRRYSTGKPSSSRIGEKVVPNYLRASTGSCHDFCKYGRKHAFEEKARPPIRRRNAKKPPDEENASISQPEENMVLKVKHKPNSNPKVEPKFPEIIKGKVSPISLNSRTAVSSSGAAANKMSSRVLLTKSVDRENPALTEVLPKRQTAAREVLTESIDSQRSVSSENRVERRNSLAPNRKTAAGTLTKSVDSKSLISGEFERRKVDHLDRKNLSTAPEKKQTAATKFLSKSVDSQSSVTGEFERRKYDALERKKALAIKLRTSLDSKTHLSPEIIKQDMSSPSGKLKVPLRQVSSKVIEEDMSAKRASSSKLRLSLPDSSRVSSGRRNSGSSTGKKTVTSKIAAKRAHTPPRASLSPKSSSRGIVKGQANPKTSLSLKPTLKVQLSSRALLSPKTSSSGTARGMASPRALMSSKSLCRVPSLNSRNHKGSEVPSPRQNQSKIEKGNNEHPEINKQADPNQVTEELKGPNNDAAQEKTLYVIKMETENKVLESDHNEKLSADLSSPPLLSAKSPSLPESSISSSHNEEDEEESEYTVTDTEDDLASEYDETESVEEAHPLEGEQKRRQREAGLLHLEDKDGQPFKLRFRQGRVIDIQPEHNTPRRLKFRKGRSIGENQNFKSDGRRSFKRRGADGHANDGNPNSEKVVLRHQDAHGKKDAQGLLNNVIEETASKLVETRKSKVKALVGAFETVISLQDGKPTASTAS